MIYNTLNSVILEGVVCSRLHYFAKNEAVNEPAKLYFEVMNMRYTTDDATGIIHEHVTKMITVAYKGLATRMSVELGTGNHVRIVGALRQDENVIQLIAEHVEIKHLGNVNPNEGA